MRRRGSGSNSSPGAVLSRQDKPAWLENLINTSSECQSCRVHDRNIFCLHCHLSICSRSRCLRPHGSHRRLQVGRWRNQEVVEFAGLARLIGCSDIKRRSTDIGDAILLKSSVQESGPSNASTCLHCGKNANIRLQEGEVLTYCSLSCKVEFHIGHSIPLAHILHRFNSELRVDNSQAIIINEDVPGSSRPNNNRITSCFPWRKLRWRRN